jgi:molybdate transport system regulatory protein
MGQEKAVLEYRLRFPQRHPEAFGPGKAELLQLIAETGSIRSAAGRLEMSYNRAWTLVRAMNRLFNEPLVTSERGGKSGGGANLTPTGQTVLELYRKMEAASEKACAKDWAKLQRLLH